MSDGKRNDYSAYFPEGKGKDGDGVADSLEKVKEYLEKSKKCLDESRNCLKQVKGWLKKFLIFLHIFYWVKRVFHRLQLFLEETRNCLVKSKKYFYEAKKHLREAKIWRKKACSMIGGGEKLEKQKKDWLVIVDIAFAIIIGLLIVLEIPIPESEQAGLGASMIKEQIYSPESLKNVLGFGLQTLLALAAFGIAVSQASGKRAREKSREDTNYKKKVLRYSIFVAVQTISYLFLFIVAEYGFKTEEIQNLRLFSVIAMLFIICSIFYFISIVPELLGKKSSKWSDYLINVVLITFVLKIVCIAIKS